MTKIIDPGYHWHKDDIEDEDPRPGFTEPNYDEHADYINEVSKATTGDDMSKADYSAMYQDRDFDDWPDTDAPF
jgi:hypothetical protein